MTQNFFDKAVYEKLKQRFNSIGPDAKPQWGIMNPAQMFRHLQLENDLALGRYKGKDHSNFFTSWSFKMVIRGKMPLPTLVSKLRMVPAIPELNVVKSGMPVADFQTEKNNLFTSFTELTQAEHFSNLHPAIGKMTPEEWGLFYYWHTDYHFRQFGV
ncbi:MAG TPA: DUF1569 domain-containing protein [Chitinophagales bacterium]|nr:DUF1569 domain-containing protein [Chitinophagales bacterium]